MRKFFITTFCICALCICNGCVEKETSSTIQDVATIMEAAGFTSECKDSKNGFTCLYQNDASVAIMFPNDGTLIYRNESGDTYALDPKQAIGKMITPYQKLMRKLDLSSQDVYTALSSMYNEAYKLEEDTMEEALDIRMSPGEYAVIIDDLDKPASLFVTNTKTNNVLYSNTGFYNAYINIDEYANIAIENATLYPIEEMPNLEVTHLYTTYKVGKDIEATSYEISPNSEGTSAFKIHKNNAYEEEIIQEVDLLEETMQITLDEGTYITFSTCTFSQIS